MGIPAETSEHHGILLLRKVNLKGHAVRSQSEIVRNLDPFALPATHDQVVPYIRRLG